MDTVTLFNRILFSSHMQEVHDDFKSDIEKAGVSEHQMYLKLHAFDRLVCEKIDHLAVKPAALADFIKEMMNNSHIHEISGLNDANVFTDIKDFLKRMVEVLEDQTLLADIVPPKTLESIFPTDDELRSHIAYFGEYCDGYTAAGETEIQNESDVVVDFFSGKSWNQIAMCDDTEIMHNTQWSDFDWNAWKYIHEIGVNEAYHQQKIGGIFRDEEMASIAVSAPAESELKNIAIQFPGELLMFYTSSIERAKEVVLHAFAAGKVDEPQDIYEIPEADMGFHSFDGRVWDTGNELDWSKVQIASIASMVSENKSLKDAVAALGKKSNSPKIQ